MSMEHVNRRGDHYYLFEGKTKTGKPKYYASKKSTSVGGNLVETLPDDFEVFENPEDSVVTVRRRKPSRILAAERNLVERLALELSGCSVVQVIIDGDQIVVYTPSVDPVDSAHALTRIFGIARPVNEDWTFRSTRFHAELRFTLKKVSERTYTCSRYCYRSFADGWMPLAGSGPLERVTLKFIPHLGRDSFFELF